MFQYIVTFILVHPNVVNECHAVALDESFMYPITYSYSQAIVILRTSTCTYAEIILQMATYIKNMNQHILFVSGK